MALRHLGSLRQLNKENLYHVYQGYRPCKGEQVKCVL